MTASTLRRGAEKGAAIALLLVLWQLLPTFHVIQPNLLPPLSEVLRTLVSETLSGEIPRNAAVSLGRAGLGFALAAAVNVPLGFALGWYASAERFVDPLLQVFRQLSPLALFPLFILFFGIGELSKVVVIAWACGWPVLLNTISGVKEVDPLLVKSARSMGVSNLGLFRKVILPAALPSILTGLRLAASTALILLIAAEMIGASAGLGFLVLDTQYKFQIPKMYAVIIAIAVIGLLANQGFVVLGRRLTGWKEQAA